MTISKHLFTKINPNEVRFKKLSRESIKTNECGVEVSLKLDGDI
jgi:hypothetical protein